MINTVKNYQHTNTGDFDFKQLYDLLLNKKYERATAKIKLLCEQVKLEDFPLAAGAYSRNVIPNIGDCWLGILRWDKDSQTPIHGHPERSFFYVLQGELACFYFQKDPLLMTSTQSFAQFEYYHGHGVRGEMDNFIHRISAKQPSISLHFYSDDPSKGEFFGA